MEKRHLIGKIPAPSLPQTPPPRGSTCPKLPHKPPLPPHILFARRMPGGIIPPPQVKDRGRSVYVWEQGARGKLRHWLSPCVLLAANLGHLLQMPTIAQPIKHILHCVLGFDPRQVSGDLIGNFSIILEILKNNLFW